MEKIYKCTSAEDQEEKFKWLYNNSDYPIFYFEYSRHHNYGSFNYDNKRVHYESYPSIVMSGYNVFCGSSLTESVTWNGFICHLRERGLVFKEIIKPIQRLKKHSMV